MRYLVISACEDARTGKEFEAGDEFLPEPDELQAGRLVKAGCLRVISDDAPVLPGTNEAEAVILDLRGQLDRASDTVTALNGRLADAATQHGSLLGEYQAARTQLDAVIGELAAIRGERDQLANRLADTEAQLDAATKPAPEQAPPTEQQQAEAPGHKAGKAKG